MLIQCFWPRTWTSFKVSFNFFLFFSFSFDSHGRTGNIQISCSIISLEIWKMNHFVTEFHSVYYLAVCRLWSDGWIDGRRVQPFQMGLFETKILHESTRKCLTGKSGSFFFVVDGTEKVNVQISSISAHFAFDIDCESVSVGKKRSY